MRIIVCIDDRNGMMFHNRRQSQDRVLQKDILKLCAGEKLYMNPYSYGLFQKHLSPQSQGNLENNTAELIVSEDFFLHVGEQDFCFLETMQDFLAANTDPSLLAQIEEVILYRWNRAYPADTYFTLDLTDGHWTLTEQTEFAGSSHERITREVYQKKKGAFS